MADISDVRKALANAVVAALYPQGTDHPSAAGITVSVFPGWPLSAQLDAAIKAGNVLVSIWGRGLGQNTTRFREDWQVLRTAVQTLTLTQVDIHTVQVGGTVSTPQVVVVNGQAYAVQPEDTLASVAAGIAALIAGATSANDQVSVQAGIKQHAIAATGTIAKETRRQTDTFQISIWAPSDDLRCAVGACIDEALSDVRFLELEEGTSARLTYANTQDFDRSENALIYRRDLYYKVEYGTYKKAFATQIATPNVDSTLELQWKA